MCEGCDAKAGLRRAALASVGTCVVALAMSLAAGYYRLWGGIPPRVGFTLGLAAVAVAAAALLNVVWCWRALWRLQSPQERRGPLWGSPGGGRE